MDLGDMDLEQLDQMDYEQLLHLSRYQAALRRLNTALVDATAQGKFNRAGRVFAQIMKVQHAYGQLPERADLDGIRAELAELDKLPGRVLGVSR